MRRKICALACVRMYDMIIPGVLLLCVLVLLRLIYLVSRRGSSVRSSLRSLPCRTLVVLGSGGHTAEMLQLLSGMTLQNYQPRVYVVAENDKMSLEKAETFESQQNSLVQIRRVSRSRKVLQSYWSSVFTTLISLMHSVPIVLRVWPDLVLCNGPGTCIPVCAVAYFIKFMGIHNVRLVYIESICRVQDLSLSGKLLYYLADHMIVQWPELKEKYPRTTYLGRIL